MATRTHTIPYRNLRQEAKLRGFKALPDPDASQVPLEEAEPKEFNFGYSPNDSPPTLPNNATPEQFVPVPLEEEKIDEVIIKMKLEEQPAWLAESHQVETILEQLRAKGEWSIFILIYQLIFLQ